MLLQRLREQEKEKEREREKERDEVERFPDSTRMKMRPLRMKVRRPFQPVAVSGMAMTT